MILGLDVSTSITGATLLDEDGNIIFNEAWDTRKFKDFFDKAEFVKEKIKHVYGNYGNHSGNVNSVCIEHIFIETALKRFIPGRSRADTIIKLAKFNGIASWLCYECFDITPTYINVNTARSLYGLSFPRGTKGPKRKKMVIEEVIEREKTDFTYEMARGGRNYKKGTDDRADAIVIARAGEFLLRNKDNKGFLTEKIVLVD